MKESTHVGNVISKQLPRVASLNTSEQYMKERSNQTDAGNVTTRQPHMVISINTSKQRRKEVPMQGLLSPSKYKV
jgi:hypothetical protein